MSTIKANNIQIGQSATPTQNFTVTTNVDGTAKIARGNAGSTTQDVLTVDAAGVVDLPVGVTSGSAPLGRMQLFAAKATTSGTYVDFSPADGTGIPSWAKRVTVTLVGVSTSGTSPLSTQLGVGSTPTAAGYAGSASAISTGVGTNTCPSTRWHHRTAIAGSDLWSGQIIITNLTGNTWAMSSVMAEASASTAIAGGTVTLNGVLGMLRFTTSNGTDTFDAGSVSILVEGY